MLTLITLLKTKGRFVNIISKLLVLFMFLLMSGCSVDDDDGTGSDLPAITSEGLYTFGCKINGQVFLPRNGQWCLACGPREPLRLSYFQDREGQYRLGINASNNINGDVHISLDLYLYEPLEERVYELSEVYISSVDKMRPNAVGCIYRDISGEKINSCFGTTSEVTGTLEIIEMNDEERFIAGVFVFQGIDQEGNIMNFSDGRFDIRIY